MIPFNVTSHVLFHAKDWQSMKTNLRSIIYSRDLLIIRCVRSCVVVRCKRLNFSPSVTRSTPRVRPTYLSCSPVTSTSASRSSSVAFFCMVFPIPSISLLTQEAQTATHKGIILHREMRQWQVVKIRCESKCAPAAFRANEPTERETNNCKTNACKHPWF